MPRVSSMVASKWKPSMRSSQRINPLPDPDKMLEDFDKENEGEKLFQLQHGEGWILFTAIVFILGMITTGIACIYTAVHP